jgi:hypothetical protein
MNETLLEIPNIQDALSIEITVQWSNGRKQNYKIPLRKVYWAGTIIPRSTPFLYLPWSVKKRFLKLWFWGERK